MPGSQPIREADHDFQDAYGADYSKRHTLYHDFNYQAGSWKGSRRVACQIERKAGELCPRHAFIVTTLAAHPQEVIHDYHKRGQMENFIKEAKLDFGMDTLSHSAFLTNAVKLLIRTLAYNLINFMKRLTLPKAYQKSRLRHYVSF